MNRPEETPLFPHSWATDGIQGARAKASGPSSAQNAPQTMTARILALAAINAARVQLDAYALATDDPDHFIVIAADCLDVAYGCMMQGGAQ